MFGTLFAELRNARVAMLRRPATLALPVLTMAVGIGASTALFSALYVALFNPLPYQEPGRLVMGRATFSGEINPWVAAPDFYDYRERASLLASLSAYLPDARRVTVRQGDGAESVPGHPGLVGPVQDARCEPGRRAPLPRRPRASAADPRWPSSATATGSARWEGRETSSAARCPLGVGPTPGTVTVVGVMPPGFRFAYDVDVWIPMQRNAQGADVRRFHNWMLLGRLKPGVALGAAQRQVDGISAQLQKDYPDSNRNKALLLTPLQEALAEGDRPNLLILMAAVGVLLLVACADVAGLLLSRGAAREAEMAVRSALGATRWRLGAQLLAESLLVAVTAGALGVLLAVWLRGLVLRFVPLDSLGVTSLPLGGPVLAFAIGVTLLTSLIVGLVPAWFGARSNAGTTLRAGSRTTEAASRALFRQGLVALQVAMSVDPDCRGGAARPESAASSRRWTLASGPGSLLTARCSSPVRPTPDASARVRFFDGFLDEVRGLPGVENANVINSVPILDKAGNIPVWDADHPPAQTSDAPLACVRFSFPGYFATMGIPLVAGRDLSRDDTGVLVAGAGHVDRRGGGRRAPAGDGDQPVGGAGGSSRAPTRSGSGWGSSPAAGQVVAEVVGVVGDVRMNSLGDDYTLAMYAPYQVMASAVMRVVVRTVGRTGVRRARAAGRAGAARPRPRAHRRQDDGRDRRRRRWRGSA